MMSIGLLALMLGAVGPTQARPVLVVAAESVYGDIAQQIGGADVKVVTILTSPTQDPHEFEASAATARAIGDAKLVIYNGADYDPWAAKLLSASGSSSREAIEVAKLVHKTAGANPHVWYDTAAVSALAATLAAKLTQLEPSRRSEYAGRLVAFNGSMGSLRARIAAMRIKYAGTPVTATEPVFGYMADALGLAMRNARFQLAVMNGTEPSARAIAAFERDLRTRTVKVLLYNTQTSQALAERMRSIATQVGVPVVPITETKPKGQRYQDWMMSQLEALDHALGSQ
jgi:zinc/manganese transport system substrate-binding protein